MRSENAKRLLLSMIVGHLPLIFAAFASSGCSGSGSDSEVAPGVLSLQLQSGPSVELSEVSYQIMRPDGFLVTGPVALATGAPQDSFGFKVDKLQPSTGYSLTVFAQGQLVASQRPTKCRGHADFAITAGQSTGVGLILQCDGVVTEGTEHGGTRNSCPSVVSLRVAPDSAPVGSEIKIVADVNDVQDGPGLLTYAWGTASGTFDGRTCESRFHCTFAGAVAVSLTISDGDGACAEAKGLVYVTCTTPECLAAGNCGSVVIDTSKPGRVSVTHFGEAGAGGDRNPEAAGAGAPDSQAGHPGGHVDLGFGSGIVTWPGRAGAGGAAGAAGVRAAAAGASGSGIAGAASASGDRPGGWRAFPGQGPRDGGHRSHAGGEGGSLSADADDAGVEP